MNPETARQPQEEEMEISFIEDDEAEEKLKEVDAIHIEVGKPIQPTERETKIKLENKEKEKFREQVDAIESGIRIAAEKRVKEKEEVVKARIRRKEEEKEEFTKQVDAIAGGIKAAAEKRVERKEKVANEKDRFEEARKIERVRAKEAAEDRLARARQTVKTADKQKPNGSQDRPPLSPPQPQKQSIFKKFLGLFNR